MGESTCESIASVLYSTNVARSGEMLGIDYFIMLWPYTLNAGTYLRNDRPSIVCPKMYVPKSGSSSQLGTSRVYVHGAENLRLLSSCFSSFSYSFTLLSVDDERNPRNLFLVAQPSLAACFSRTSPFWGQDLRVLRGGRPPRKSCTVYEVPCEWLRFAKLFFET